MSGAPAKSRNARVSGDSGSSFLPVNLAPLACSATTVCSHHDRFGRQVAYARCCCRAITLAAVILGSGCLHTIEQDSLAQSLDPEPTSGLSGSQVCHSKFLTPGQGAHF